MPRNPAWTRDELILALDLYFRLRHNSMGISENQEEVKKLSALLNQLPIHDRKPDEAKFRNPSGVYMKLMNFARLDPDYPGVGLRHGGKLEEEIWNEFSGDPVYLNNVWPQALFGV